MEKSIFSQKQSILYNLEIFLTCDGLVTVLTLGWEAYFSVLSRVWKIFGDVFGMHVARCDVRGDLSKIINDDIFRDNFFKGQSSKFVKMSVEIENVYNLCVTKSNYIWNLHFTAAPINVL